MDDQTRDSFADLERHVTVLDKSMADVDKRVAVLEARMGTHTESLKLLDQKIDQLRSDIGDKLDKLGDSLNAHLNDEGKAAKMIQWQLIGLILTILGAITVALI